MAWRLNPFKRKTTAKPATAAKPAAKKPAWYNFIGRIRAARAQKLEDKLALFQKGVAFIEKETANREIKLKEELGKNTRWDARAMVIASNPRVRVHQQKIDAMVQALDQKINLKKTAQQIVPKRIMEQKQKMQGLQTEMKKLLEAPSFNRNAYSAKESMLFQLTQSTKQLEKLRKGYITNDQAMEILLGPRLQITDNYGTHPHSKQILTGIGIVRR